MNGKHLTNEEFAECLTAKSPDPVVQAHLAQCDACRLELGEFLATMEDFSLSALEWSQEQVPMTVRPLRSQRARIVGGQLPLRWALVAVVIAAVGVPMALHHERESGGEVKVVEAEDSQAQIAQDNTLLKSVDLVLGENDPSPLQEYGLSGSQKRMRVRAQTRVE